MNKLVTWLTGTTTVGLIAVLALYGKQAIEALTAFPALLAAFSSGLPFGLLSALLAFAISALAFSMLHRNLTGPRKEVVCDLLALGVAITVTLLQQAGTTDNDPPDMLRALLIGLLAGLAAPTTVRVMMAAAKTPPPQ